MRLRTSFEQAEAFAERVMGLAPAQQTPEPVPVEPPPSPMPPVPHEEPEPDEPVEPPRPDAKATLLDGLALQAAQE